MSSPTVDELISKMTLAEKIGQTHQLAQVDAAAEDLIRQGLLGSRLFASGAFAGNVKDDGAAAQEANRLQRIAVEESRLGIPLLFCRDVIHGHRTVFPIPLGQAATWDPEQAREGARIAAQECTADGVRLTFAPMMDVARDPRWGRMAEGYGEDPLLNARFAAATVRGFQGDDLADPARVAACAKHFVGYGACEGGRDYNTTDLSERTLREVYLPPFKAAVEAGCATVMSSFNEIGGIPVSAHAYLLRTILKEEWGFDGVVISDWNAVGELIDHGIAAGPAAAARLGLRGGVDIDMVSGAYRGHLAEESEKHPDLDALIDDSVRRILRLKIELGLFDNPYVDETRAAKVMRLPDSRAAARRCAAESIVLLKNAGGVLPLAADLQQMVLTGPLCRARRELLGTWTLDGKEEETVSLEEGLRAAFPDAHVDVEPLADDGPHRAAFRGDVVVAAFGESHLRSGELHSVCDIGLPPGQAEALKALKAMGRPVVAVVFAGRALALAEIEPYVDALVVAWHPGSEGGHAVADVLAGKVNPSGRLPVTFPRATGQVPCHYNHKPTGRGFARNVTLDQPRTPLYPFGFGLSYSIFQYENLRLSADRISGDDELAATVTVRNAGDRAGTETVQLYVRDQVASVTRPVRELKDFARVTLAPGASAEVELRLRAADLAFWRADETWGPEPGKFTLRAGPDSTRGLEAEFVLE
jgi:beta-glucosidase